MADDVMAEIENEIRGNKIMIYMKGNPTFPQCGFSAATIEIFEELGRPFQTVDVLSAPGKRDAIKRYSNWPTIPQVYVNGKFIGGCDIVRELHERGELRRILDEAFAA
jgi:monothiol glutaredoxin